MKFEVGNLKCGRRRGLEVSNVTLYLSSFHLAVMIKENFEELGA
jgi:hypothetical protein